MEGTERERKSLSPGGTTGASSDFARRSVPIMSQSPRSAEDLWSLSHNSSDENEEGVKPENFQRRRSLTADYVLQLPDELKETLSSRPLGRGPFKIPDRYRRTLSNLRETIASPKSPRLQVKASTTTIRPTTKPLEQHYLHEDRDVGRSTASVFDIFDHPHAAEVVDEMDSRSQREDSSRDTERLYSSSKSHLAAAIHDIETGALNGGGDVPQQNGSIDNIKPPVTPARHARTSTSPTRTKRLDSEKQAELREGGDVFHMHGKLTHSSWPTPFPPSPPPSSKFNKLNGKMSIDTGVQKMDVNAGVPYKYRDFSPAGRAGVQVKGSGGGSESDDAWLRQAGTDIQALGRRLAFKRKQSTRGDWSTGAGNPLKKEGLVTVFLILMGFIHGASILTITAAMNYLLSIRSDLGNHRSYGVGFVLFSLYTVGGTSLSAYITARFSPQMAGSGIPVIKWFLGTDNIKTKAKSRLTARAWVVKAVGLILAGGTGLNVGREGPSVHLAGILCYLMLTKLIIFEDIAADEGLLRQMLVASASVGVSSVFNAIVGGVLFAVEVTSTYYLVAQYFKGFLASVAGAAARRLFAWPFLGEEASKEAEIPTTITPRDYSFRELIFFSLLGMTCGGMGPIYVRSRLILIKQMRRIGCWHLRNAKGEGQTKFIWLSVLTAAAVALVTAILAYFPGEYTRLGPYETLADLVKSTELPAAWQDPRGGPWSALVIAFITKWFTAVLGTSVVVPAGDFIQTAVLGGIFGRLIGEAIALWLDYAQPETYALIGAAAFACGATQSISAAVMLLEIVQNIALELPTVVGSVAAYLVSYRQGLNIYDSIMKLNGLKSLRGLAFNTRKALERCAYHIMSQAVCLSARPTVNEVVELLEESPDVSSFPVVSDKKERVFLGTIDRTHLVGSLLRASHGNAAYESHLSHRIPREIEGYHQLPAREKFHRTITNILSNIRSFTPDSPHMSRSPGGTRLSHGHGSRDAGRQTSNQQLNLSVLNKGGWDAQNVGHVLEEAFLRLQLDLVEEDRRGWLYIDSSSWMVPENMALANLHILFELLRAPRLFVVWGGQLRGVVTAEDLYDALCEATRTLSSPTFQEKRP